MSAVAASGLSRSKALEQELAQNSTRVVSVLDAVLNEQLSLLSGTQQSYEQLNALQQLLCLILNRLFSQEVTLQDDPSHLVWLRSRGDDARRYGWIGGRAPGISTSVMRDVFRPNELSLFVRLVRSMRERKFVTVKREFLPVKAQLFLHRDRDSFSSWTSIYEQIANPNWVVWDSRSGVVEATRNNDIVQVEMFYFFIICLCRFPLIWGADRSLFPDGGIGGSSSIGGNSSSSNSSSGNSGSGGNSLRRAMLAFDNPRTLLLHTSVDLWKSSSPYLQLFNELLQTCVPYFPDLDIHHRQAALAARDASQLENQLRIVAEELLDSGYLVHHALVPSSGDGMSSPAGGAPAAVAAAALAADSATARACDPLSVQFVERYKVVNSREEGYTSSADTKPEARTLGALQCVYLAVARVVADPRLPELYQAHLEVSAGPGAASATYSHRSPHTQMQGAGGWQPQGRGRAGLGPGGGSEFFPHAVFQQPLFDVLRVAFHEVLVHQRTPGEQELDSDKYQLLVESWLLWLQPWKAAPGGQASTYSDRWRLYVASNLHFYTTLLVLFLRAHSKLPNTLNDASSDHSRSQQLAVLQKVLVAFSDGGLVEAVNDLTERFAAAYPQSRHCRRRAPVGGDVSPRGAGRSTTPASVGGRMVPSEPQQADVNMANEAMRLQHHHLFPSSLPRGRGDDAISVDDCDAPLYGITTIGHGRQAVLDLVKLLRAEWGHHRLLCDNKSGFWPMLLTAMGLHSEEAKAWFSNGLMLFLSVVTVGSLVLQLGALMLGSAAVLILVVRLSATPGKTSEDNVAKLAAALRLLADLAELPGDPLNPSEAFDLDPPTCPRSPRSPVRALAGALAAGVSALRRSVRSKKMRPFANDELFYLNSRRFDALEGDPARRHVYSSEWPWLVDVMVRASNGLNKRFDLPRSYKRDDALDVDGNDASGPSGAVLAGRLDMRVYPRTWKETLTLLVQDLRSTPNASAGSLGSPASLAERWAALKGMLRFNLRPLAHVRFVSAFACLLLRLLQPLSVRLFSALLCSYPGLWLVASSAVLVVLTIFFFASRQPTAAAALGAAACVLLALYATSGETQASPQHPPRAAAKAAMGLASRAAADACTYVTVNSYSLAYALPLYFFWQNDASAIDW